VVKPLVLIAEVDDPLDVENLELAQLAVEERRLPKEYPCSSVAI
jgi:hypothetical protein